MAAVPPRGGHAERQRHRPRHARDERPEDHACADAPDADSPRERLSAERDCCEHGEARERRREAQHVDEALVVGRPAERRSAEVVGRVELR